MSTSTDLILEMLRLRISPDVQPGAEAEVEVTESTWDQFEAAQRALEQVPALSPTEPGPARPA